MQRSGLDQGTVDEICKKMEEAIEAKNSILKNLKYSLAHATKAYNDAIRVYEAKLVEFGIPAEELGLEPLVTNTSTMPAGLVAAWKRWLFIKKIFGTITVPVMNARTTHGLTREILNNAYLSVRASVCVWAETKNIPC